MEKSSAQRRATFMAAPESATGEPSPIGLSAVLRPRSANVLARRQWRDILGIVLVQENRLDEDYLRDGARLLDVRDLLDRALRVRS